MRIVIDTNVFVSGIFNKKSVPGKIIEAFFDAILEVVCSIEQLAELSNVLFYPKVYKTLQKNGWNEESISGYIKTISLAVELADISLVDAIVPRDHKDNHILALLISSEADYLVTGDNDLLALSEEYSILSPKDFFDKWL